MGTRESPGLLMMGSREALEVEEEEDEVLVETLEPDSGGSGVFLGPGDEEDWRKT